MKRLLLIAIACFSFSLWSNAQAVIVLNEIDSFADRVEIKNTGDMSMDISGYFLCSFPVYTQLGNMTVESGSLNLAPGELVVVQGHSMGNMDDELGLYIIPDYDNEDAIIDYVEWGSAGHFRTGTAIGAGVWSANEFISQVMMGMTFQYDGDGDLSSDWVTQAPTFGAENFGGGCEVEGGTISTTDATSVCVGDGNDDLIDASVDGATGTNNQWVITDIEGNILELPMMPPFNFDGAPEGICLIWNLSYEDGITGAEVGMNANDIEGCFALSNAIEVVRTEVNGGTLSTSDENNVFDICAGDGIGDPIDVTLEGNFGTNSQWVITDDAGNILGLPPGPPFDLEEAGGGTCLIWHLSYEDGLEGAAVGNNVSMLEGCFALSNEVTVNRTGVNGGTIATTDPTTICAGDGMDDFVTPTLEGAEGANSQWVITDADGNILELPAAPPFNFEGAGEGVCLIWHLSFEDGLTGAEVGMNASDLEGCFALSNPIEINRLVGDDCECLVSGGTISTEDPTAVCVGDGNDDLVNATLAGATGENNQWVITDGDGNILELPMMPPFNFEGAPDGICLIWNLSYDGEITGAEVGNNASDIMGCFALSNAIEVVRTEVNGGELSTSNDDNVFDICAGDGEGDPIDVTLEGNLGGNSQWVITDEAGNILGLPAGPPFDLDEAGPGTCLIWHMSYEDGLTGAEEGNNVDMLDGCFALSNPVTVNRTEIVGGTVATADGDVEIDLIVNDNIADEIEFAVEGNVGEEFVYIVTDEDGSILAVLDDTSLDFEGGEPGICYVYGMTYYGTLDAEAGDNIDDISADDCYSLSDNFITVNRDVIFSVGETTVQTLEIWPNPATDEVNVNLPQGIEIRDVRIFSVAGQLVAQETEVLVESSRISVSTLETGLYTVIMSSLDGQVFRTSLVKQ